MLLKFLSFLVVIKSEILDSKYLLRGYIFENSFFKFDLEDNFNIRSFNKISLKFYRYSDYGELGSITKTKLLSLNKETGTIRCKFLTLDHYQNSFIDEEIFFNGTFNVYKAVYTIITDEKEPRTIVFYDWMTISKTEYFHYKIHHGYGFDDFCWDRVFEDNRVKYFRLLKNISPEHIRKKFDEFNVYSPNISKRECFIKYRLVEGVTEVCRLALREYFGPEEASVATKLSQENIECYKFWKEIRDDAKILETRLAQKQKTFPQDVIVNKAKNTDNFNFRILWKPRKAKYHWIEGMSFFANIIGMRNKEIDSDKDCWPMFISRNLHLPTPDLFLRKCAYINKGNGEGKDMERGKLYFYFSKSYDFKKDKTCIFKTCQGVYDFHTYCIFDESMIEYKYLRAAIINTGYINYK